MNDEGTIEKHEYPFMNRTMVLMDEAKATARNRPYDVDLGFGNVVETEEQLEKDAHHIIAKLLLDDLTYHTWIVGRDFDVVRA